MSKSLHKHICNEKVFSAVYNKYAKDLHNFLFFKYGESLSPRDKVQEAFTKLWENCSKVTPDKAKAFVFTTANNLMLNAIKHQKVVFKFKDTKPKSYTNESPEFVMQENQYKQKLEVALANLTEAQRTAFLMNRVEGKKFKDIALLLDISTKAVEKRIYSALKKLREDIDGI